VNIDVSTSTELTIKYFQLKTFIPVDLFLRRILEKYRQSRSKEKLDLKSNLSSIIIWNFKGI
jgi:hypothetical protein